MSGEALPPGYALHDGADAAAAQAFLTDAYWAKGRTLAMVERSFARSTLVSATFDGVQVGMARGVSDGVTFAYVTDVYVLDAHRGIGLARALMRRLRDHPDLVGARRWLLSTNDAHGVYEGVGWAVHPRPERLMTIPIAALDG